MTTPDKAESLATPVPGAVSNAMVQIGWQHRTREWARHETAKWSEWIDGRRAPLKFEPRDYEERAVYALEAAVQSPPVGVGALEWESRDGDWVARPAAGPCYGCQQFGSEWDLLIDGYHTQPKVHGIRKAHATLEQAQAAAQADYEARIRSALSSPAPVEAVATEPVADDFQWKTIDGWISCSISGSAEQRREYAQGMAAKVGLGYRELYATPTGDSGALREALKLEDIFAGFIDWSNKPHNAKWVRKLDGTPIANDICVCIFDRLRATLSKGEPGK